MSRAARSVFVFGIYMVVMGTALMVMPNVLLSLFGIGASSDVWIRVVGVLVVILAFYYVQAARNELTEFLGWTVYTRSSLIVFLVLFVALDLAEPILIPFGFVDLLGAIWTRSALRGPRAS